MALYQSQNLNGRIRSVGQFLLKVALLLFLSCITAVSLLVIRSHDPVYVLRELKDWTDYRRYDTLITKVAGGYDWPEWRTRSYASFRNRGARLGCCQGREGFASGPNPDS